MLLRLVKGSTTITLSGDGAYITACTYVPRTPEIDEQEIRSIVKSGGDMAALARKNVTERARVILSGTSSQMLTQVRAIEALFAVEEAEMSKGAPKVYVEFRIEASGDVCRSEVLSGRVEWPEVSISRRLAGGHVEILVIWKRRHYWEEPEVSLPLTNGNGSNVTSGLTVWNHDDGDAGHDNRVSIAAASVGGVIPAPCRITMKNIIGAAADYNEIWIGHNVYANLSGIGYGHMIEAEILAGGLVSDGAASGGQYKNLSATPLAGGYVWAAHLLGDNYLEGRKFAILARFHSLTNLHDVRMRASVRYDALVTLAEGPEIRLGISKLRQLGVFAIPPALAGITGLGGTNLSLFARSVTGGAITVPLDYVALLPTDSYRKLSAIYQDTTWSIANNDSWVDDGIESSSYVHASPGGKMPLLSGQGAILLHPGRNQELYFLSNRLNGESPITDRLSVTVHYRPRRLTI